MFSRTDRSVLGQWWWTVDRGLLAALLALIGFGVVMVAAASPPVAERIGLDQYHFVYRHLVFLIPALVLLFGMSLLNQQNIWRISSLVFLGGLGAMIAVLIFGMEIKGAQRWLHLFGFSLQPSEFIKPAFAVTAAWFIAQQQDKPSFPGFYIAVFCYALVALLLLMQPDFGMTFVVSLIFGVQVFLAGLPLLWIAVLLVGGIVFAISSYFMFDHVQSRIDSFFNPASGDNYQVDKSMEAFQSGGLFGTGPGQGVIKLELPDAHADFIFAVAGEELGLLFCLLLILLFVFVFLRGLKRVMDSNDMFVVLAVSGLLTMFAAQALIHMGSSLHLLPAKGMTLPFVSYGGSSLWAVSYAMGMVLALTRKWEKPRTVSKSGVKRKRTRHA